MKRYIFIISLILLFTSYNRKSKVSDVYKIMENISVSSNITYKTIDSLELKLDVYYPAKKLGKEPFWEKVSEHKKPVLIYFHGGGWISGDKTSRFLGLLPYLEKGWCVVNVDYRLLQETSLIGSLNDCIDAINWVNDSGSYFKFDTDRIYLSGESAGGHLALLAGMMNGSEFGANKVHKRNNKIKGIINWYGVTEMKSAIQFWNDDDFTKMIMDHWEGDKSEYLEITSPIHLVSKNNTPPIISVHGDKDLNVDIEQSISFHRKLETNGIKNKLVTIKGKKHGDFTSVELEMIFDEIWNFYELEN